MDRKIEAMAADMKGGANETGHETEKREDGSETQKKDLLDSSEQASAIDVTDVIVGLDGIDRDILAARKRITATRAQLTSLREGLGLPSTAEESLSVSYENTNLRKLEERRTELNRQKETWIERHGRENFPDGIALDDGEDGREAKGGSFEEQQMENEELTKEENQGREKEKNDDLEMRKEWLRRWEEKTVRNFAKAMQNDWMTRDAVNLDLAIELMKMRVPKAMDKRAENFINGKVDIPPFSAVWIHWEASALLDRILGKPNQVKKLEVTFDDEVERIAEEEELKTEQDGKDVAKEADAQGVAKQHR